MSEYNRRAIWVFGSNLQGIHGGGAALVAKEEYGAQMGVSRGRTGNAYAIPTKTSPWGQKLALNEIREYVDEFIRYATEHSTDAFLVTRVGCMLAGWTNEDIGPMFADAPPNCIFETEWQYIISKNRRFEIN